MRERPSPNQQMIGPHLPADPRDWPDAVKLVHAMRMAEKTIDRYPNIADSWLQACDTIRSRMVSQADSNALIRATPNLPINRR